MNNNYVATPTDSFQNTAKNTSQQTFNNQTNQNLVDHIEALEAENKKLLEAHIQLNEKYQASLKIDNRPSEKESIKKMADLLNEKF